MTLDNWKSDTDDSWKILNFGAFMYKLGVERPDVKLHFTTGLPLPFDLLAG